MKTRSGTHLPNEGDVWPGVTESVSQPDPPFSELFPEHLPVLWRLHQRGYQNWTWSSSLELSLICCTNAELMSSAEPLIWFCPALAVPTRVIQYGCSWALFWEKASKSRRNSLNSFKSGWCWFVRIKISCCLQPLSRYGVLLFPLPVLQLSENLTLKYFYYYYVDCW